MTGRCVCRTIDHCKYSEMLWSGFPSLPSHLVNFFFVRLHLIGYCQNRFLFLRRTSPTHKSSCDNTVRKVTLYSYTSRDLLFIHRQKWVWAAVMGTQNRSGYLSRGGEQLILPQAHPGGGPCTGGSAAILLPSRAEVQWWNRLSWKMDVFFEHKLRAGAFLLLL
jgi:hypothetical protein